MTLLLPAALIDGLFRFGADLKFIPLSLFLLSARAGRCHPQSRLSFEWANGLERVMGIESTQFKLLI